MGPPDLGKSPEALVGHLGGWETVVGKRQTNILCREREFEYRVYSVGYGSEGEWREGERKRERKSNVMA